MIITRWQAPIVPTRSLLITMLEGEGLDPIEETFDPQVKIEEHRHPFDEVRFIISGELMFNIAGNQFLLRPGDRVDVPAHTKHWHITQGKETCVCLYSQRTA